MPKEVFESSAVSMEKILAQVEEGTMQLPEFQRDFVWTENKQKELINSIYKGYPIGSLLLMCVGSTPQLAFRPIKTFTTKIKLPKYLVLDGQQRVTTIAYAFSEKHTKQTRAFLNIRKLMELRSIDPTTIDLTEHNIIQIEKWSSKDLPIEYLKKKDLLPCSTIFDTNTRGDLLQEFRNYLRKKNGSENAFLNFLDRLDPYFERLRNYRFPSIIIHEDADLDVVSTIFTQLNTQGQRLSAFDLCLAKYYKESNGKWQLRSFLEDVKEADPLIDMVDDDGTSFLQSIALMANVEHKKASLVKHLSYEHIKKHKTEVIDSFIKIGRFFQETFKCTSIKEIPYDTTIPPLCLVFNNFSRIKVGRRAIIEQKIKKWIIVSALKKWYTEGTDVKQLEDKKITVPFILGFESKEPSNLVDPWILDNEFIQSSSGSRKTILVQLLKMNEAKDFISDYLPNEKHHIFPKKYLRSCKVDDKTINSILNLTLISKQTNASIGGSPPSYYLAKEIIPTLMKKHRETKSVAEKRLRSIMEKHFINEEAFKRLLADDYSGFLRARGKSLGEHLHQEYGINYQDTGSK